MTDEISHDLIWILDNDPECVALYQQTLGLQYMVRAFESVDALIEGLVLNEPPRLLITDPQRTVGSFSEAFKRVRNASGSSLRLPEFMIVSDYDELDLMRFYLKAGARDYLLKPIRPNELVAKVERILLQISNREVLILRNELDGIQINDLTFREHQMLTIFLSRPNRAVPRDDLYNAIWNKVTVNRKTLDVHLFNLRRKLRPNGYDIVCEGQTFHLRKQQSPSAN